MTSDEHVAGAEMSPDWSPPRAVSAHRHARFGALSVGHFVMLFGVPTVFGKWLYFQYVIRFVLGKSLFLTFCFQDVPRFVVFRKGWTRSRRAFWGV